MSAREAGEAYLVMEWCDAGDLEGVMHALAKRGERMPLPLVCHVMSGLLAGLAYAHQATDADDKPLGLVHRDVSPGNVLFTYAGEVKLSDFGIARAAERLVSTGAGIVKGKAAYLSPEQARGETATAQSDLFSAGIVFWEMLAGRRLFAGGETREILARIGGAEVPRPDRVREDCPASLAAVLLRALTASPSDRYPTADDFARELSRVRRQEGLDGDAEPFALFLRQTVPPDSRPASRPVERTPALPASEPGPPSPLKIRRSWRVALGIAAALLFIVGGAFAGRWLLAPSKPRAVPKSAAPLPEPELTERNAVVSLAKTPEGALAVLDGRPLGFAPVRAAVTAERRRRRALRVTLPGRASYDANIYLTPAKERRISKRIRLAPEMTKVPAVDEDRMVAGRRVRAGESPYLPNGLYRVEDAAGAVSYLRVGD
ncbi:MAG: serine/threonine protein kinase [Deltaproteobacteria bacterium]|nr:serine/threonine protein kinase [Deltaproteobacteria bacterium]